MRGSSSAQVVRLGGRLDVTTAGRVRPMLHDAVVEGAGDLVLDLARVGDIDATGLGVLVGTHRRARHLDRRLILRDPSPRVTRLLTMTGLHRVLQVEVSSVAA